MKAIDCRRLAEEWVEHVVRQYGRTHISRKDLCLIQYLLQKGYTLIAVRDEAKVLHVDFLTKKVNRKKREPASCLPEDD